MLVQSVPGGDGGGEIQSAVQERLARHHGGNSHYGLVSSHSIVRGDPPVMNNINIGVLESILHCKNIYYDQPYTYLTNVNDVQILETWNLTFQLTLLNIYYNIFDISCIDIDSIDVMDLTFKWVSGCQGLHLHPLSNMYYIP